MSSLSSAVDALHRLYGIPHIVITSVTFGSSSNNKMFCAGSSITSTGHSRKFKIDVPVIGGIFVGTGDMFAALTLARFREESDRAGLLGGKSWLSDDTVLPLNLPLARAVEKVLSSMQSVLQRTKEKREIRLAALEPAAEDGKVKQTVLMKASELQLVQGQNDLRVPKDDFHAEPLETVVMN